MDKWSAIAIIGFMFAASMPMSIGMLNNTDVEKAQAGLEECPKRIGSNTTIWVKDCVAYTTKLQELKGK